MSMKTYQGVTMGLKASDGRDGHVSGRTLRKRDLHTKETECVSDLWFRGCCIKNKMSRASKVLNVLLNF